MDTCKERIGRLFAGWEDTLVLSCLQGHMGRALLNRSGSAGQIVNGDFCFFAGRPDTAFVREAGAPIIAWRTPDWEPAVAAAWAGRAEKHTRYAIRRMAPEDFDRSRLEALAAGLPEGFSLKLFDGECCRLAMEEDWSRDFCSLFAGEADYLRRGLGVAVLHRGRLAAGASSYAVFDGGIEIEIDTRPELRRRGLASACGAALILECLRRGLYPGWDAHDLRSVALAEKLGYRMDHPYPVYILSR